MKIIIIGGKGTAINIAESIIDARNNYNADAELIGFSIDDPLLGNSINGIPIVCTIPKLGSQYNRFQDVKYIFALYKPTVMKERVSLLNNLNLPPNKFTNFCHPLAYIASSSSIGIGNVFLAHTCVNSNARLGNYNIVNQNVIIEHDSTIGNSNFIAAGAIIGSHVNIEDGNFIGIHSSIRENVVVGSFNTIGIGAVLLQHIDSNKTMIGVPARPLNK